MIAAVAPVDARATVVAAHAADRIDARRSLLTFTRRMAPFYRASRHHQTIAEHLEAVEAGAIRRLIVTMPPRHGKSELASNHFPAWFLGRNPDARVIGCAHTQQLAERFSRHARGKLYDPKWPFAARPADDLRGVRSWDIAGHRGGYVAAGVGGPITGYGADLLVVDDPVKSSEEADSVAFRDRAWDWWTGTAVTRLEPGGRAVVIGTRWHEDDLIGRLVAGGGWTVLHLPAVADDGAALWPERFDADALARIKTEVGSRNFEALYQGRPSPAEGGTFKRDWWRTYGEPPRCSTVELYMDSAFKEGVANDYSVIACWGATGAGDYYLLDLWRDKVDYPGLIRVAHQRWDLCRERFGARAFVVEDKASGQSAIQTLSKPSYTAGGMLPALPVVPFPIPAGASKLSRAEGISGIVESGHCHLPKSAPWVGDFVEEHAKFPTGTHDDQVDTTSMALARLRKRTPAVAAAGMAQKSTWGPAR